MSRLLKPFTFEMLHFFRSSPWITCSFSPHSCTPGQKLLGSCWLQVQTKCSCLP